MLKFLKYVGPYGYVLLFLIQPRCAAIVLTKFKTNVISKVKCQYHYCLISQYPLFYLLEGLLVLSNLGCYLTSNDIDIKLIK